jgi:hypothetical protein
MHRDSLYIWEKEANTPTRCKTDYFRDVVKKHGRRRKTRITGSKASIVSGMTLDSPKASISERPSL